MANIKIFSLEKEGYSQFVSYLKDYGIIPPIIYTSLLKRESFENVEDILVLTLRYLLVESFDGKDYAFYYKKIDNDYYLFTMDTIEEDNWDDVISEIKEILL